jgi:hypothetical protein
LKRTKNKNAKRVWHLFFTLSFLITGCVGAPPNEDYNLAHAAIEAAKIADAPRYAPGLFEQAEQFYKLARTQYSEREYSAAQKNFIRTRQYAEKAENISILQRVKSGGL